MICGYARVSTLDQVAGYEDQQRQLEAAGCTKLFCEQISGTSADGRQQLAAALDYVREGDVLVVTKLDRLARSVIDLMHIVETLRAKQVGLRILGLGLDTATPTGRLMLQVLGAVAEFEAAIIKERMRAGIDRAKLEGKYRGRAPTARRQQAEIVRLRGEGLGASEIAAKLRIGRASVYRCLADAAD